MGRSGHRTGPWLSPVLLGIVAWVIAGAVVSIVDLDELAYYLIWLAAAMAAVLLGTIVLVPRRRRAEADPAKDAVAPGPTGQGRA